MIIALVTALMLLAGGGAMGFLGDISAYEKQIKAEVKDDARRDAALETMDGLRSREKAYRDSLSGFLEELGQTGTAKVVTEQQLQELLKPFMADVRSYHRGVIDARFDLRAEITREEWAAIFRD